MHLLTRNIAVITLLLAAQACARVPATEQALQEEAMNGHAHSAARVRSLQDQAAGMADAAVDEAGAQSPAPVVGSAGYSSLPQGPEVTAETLVHAIVHMAKTFESREDMVPSNVAQVTALGMMPDSQRERTGVQGTIGHARYDFAAWKRFGRHPGHSIELTLRPPGVCEISYKSLHDPLVAAGFGVTTNAPGFKPMVYFGRAVSGGLRLDVILNTDSHANPQCVSRVRMEMEPSDA